MLCTVGEHMAAATASARTVTLACFLHVVKLSLQYIPGIHLPLTFDSSQQLYFLYRSLTLNSSS